MSPIRSCVPLLASVLLSGCASANAFNALVDVFSSGETAYVREGGASLSCGTTGDRTQVQLFPDLAAWQQWEQAHGLTLLKKASGTYRYALIEMGARPSGGYGILVSRKALLDGDLLTLRATVIQPTSDQTVSPQPTQPCSLVVLPQGDYTQVEVQDQEGQVIATTAPAAS